jgi:thermitase
MKRSLTVALACIALMGALLWVLPTRAAPHRGTDPYMPNEVVVRLHSIADAPALATDYGLNPTPLDQFGSRPILRFSITDGALPPAKAAALRNDSRVMAAEPNYTSEIPEGQQLSEWAVGGSSDEYIGQWVSERLHLEAAHTASTGAGVIVAVLDTGIDASHPALAGRVLPGFDFVDFDNDPREVGVYEQDFGYGHGTHVAGLIALTAPDARILPIRILEPDGTGNLWVLMEGLEYAVAQGADVVNLSFSFTRHSSVLSEIVKATICDDEADGCLAPHQGGVVFVAAAGNHGMEIHEFPAAEAQTVQGLLAVAATTVTDTLATFSTYGNWVKIGAPGQSVLSTVPDNQYGTWSGTSMAAPLTAGVAALVRAQNPTLKPSQVVTRLINMSDRLNNQVVKYRLNAAAAVGVMPPLRTKKPSASFLP